MILHIGSDRFVPLDSVLAVLDAQSNPSLLSQALEGGSLAAQAQRVGDQAVKSLVVTMQKDGCVLFLSPIAAQTLRKRVSGGLT